MGYDENSRNELNNEEEKEPIIKESSAPKLKRKLKKLGEVVLLSLIGAVIFGVVSRYIFTVSEGPINKLLGIEKDNGEDKKDDNATVKNTTGNGSSDVKGNGDGNSNENRNVVTLMVDKPIELTIGPDSQETAKADQSGTVTGTPTGKAEVYPLPTGDDVKVDNDVTNTPEVSPEVYPTEAVIRPTDTPAVSTSHGNGTSKEDDGKGSSVSQYLNVYDELRNVAANTQKALVTVRSHTDSVNWMGENVENVTETFGAFVADNGDDYFVATYYDGTISADRLSVILCTGAEYQATILERDSRYNIAILRIPMNTVADEDKAEIKMLVCDYSNDIYSGMPIIALGSPNGTIGSLEYGFVTASGNRVYVVDGQVDTFTTNITNSDRSEGIIINYEGKAIGVITKSIDTATKGSVSTSIGIDSIIGVVQDMCNGEVKPYVGMKAETVPAENLATMGLENGICVNEVVASSPADAAGIRKGDVIISVDGIGVNSIEDFMNNVVDVDSSDGAEIAVRRGGQISSPELTLLLIPRSR